MFHHKRFNQDMSPEKPDLDKLAKEVRRQEKLKLQTKLDCLSKNFMSILQKDNEDVEFEEPKKTPRKVVTIKESKSQILNKKKAASKDQLRYSSSPDQNGNNPKTHKNDYEENRQSSPKKKKSSTSPDKCKHK